MQDRAPSLEHVFPLAIGGTITTKRVCGKCNSDFGSRVDAALSDFMPIRARRAELKLAGNSGKIPGRFEILEGVGTMIGTQSSRVRSWIDPTTGKLEKEQLFESEDYVRADGQKDIRFTIDARRANEIPDILQKVRKRHGMTPLTEEELARKMQEIKVNTIENPVIAIPIAVNFDFLRHAMLKIAYELAFLWLGEEYLNDPVARQLRAAVGADDPASTDDLSAVMGFSKDMPGLQLWSHDPTHHLAYAIDLMNGSIMIVMRIFDIYAAAITVSGDPGRYLSTPGDREKLRFLAIDAPSGRTIETSFDEEKRLMLAYMRQWQVAPPIPDPLSRSSGRPGGPLT